MFNRGFFNFSALVMSLTLVIFNASSQNIDSTEFENLYTSVFAKSCYLSGCHDGTFEPDFSSLTSAYYTTVLHPVKKNNEKGEFEYRIVPYEYKESLLYQRITCNNFVDKGDRMPLLHKKLSKSKIRAIKKWIQNGARDWDGNSPI